MSRIDQVPDNQIVERITRLTRAIEELRTTAQGFGSDSVLMYRIFSNSQYDMSVTGVQYNNKIVEVTFTPSDRSRSGLGGVLRFECDAYIGGVRQEGGVMMIERLLPTDGTSKWRLYLTGGNQTIDLKFHFFTNGSGTFAASLV